METKVLKALLRSAHKWDKIAKGKGTDQGTDNCALCELFIANFCRGCPVSAHTHNVWCVGSPYETWDADKTERLRRMSDLDADWGWVPAGQEGRKVARAERDFLLQLAYEAVEPKGN